ncbi:YggS family pyridoxal phosphate-dependent enzyme [Shewanella yunxiaonensis]|uniref:Pyridoxal phosphate homeostasis protein n=1 Tax=Shewanella yunxiaonensis TaxID=2829809 RepID=A0ABX7YWH2_9GAMM|nr:MULTISPECIES: YggS family pyridoxal phosphate-dependent enzyme [Shewanella]MDF0532795.1 YggS family pyridoxal phosphate-dependent enzyme [Shewanella sp. A32]QUN06680.1 YggS family pyridoxal phosphate-dependent enzyme [Shewanella yunxiaonensis]
MTTIAERLALAQHRIAQAAGKCSRQAADITLLAVSKTKPATDIEAAYAAGQRCFGENYVQEGQQKILDLAPRYPDIEWHFIGPLQSNKSRPVAELFQWMHTIDRSKIAQRLNEQRPAAIPPLNVCIQINVSGETSKSGITSEAEMLSLAHEISQLPRLTLRGLMTIPSAEEGEKLIAEFQQMQQLYARLQQEFPPIDTLSMGMSHDLELAVEHGATMVRIGSAIFGARDYSQKPA